MVGVTLRMTPELDGELDPVSKVSSCLALLVSLDFNPSVVPLLPEELPPPFTLFIFLRDNRSDCSSASFNFLSLNFFLLFFFGKKKNFFYFVLNLFLNLSNLKYFFFFLFINLIKNFLQFPNFINPQKRVLFPVCQLKRRRQRVQRLIKFVYDTFDIIGPRVRMIHIVIETNKFMPLFSNSI